MKSLKDLFSLLRRPTPGPPAVAEFGGEQAYETQAKTLRMREPVIAGSVILLLFLVGLFLWAAVAPIYGAVMAPGTVRVEGNSKQVRHLEAGVIRRIYVHEGQRVERNQLLIRFDNTQPQAGVQIFQSAVDSARLQVARFQAEALNANDLTVPQSLLERAGDPAIAALIEVQRNLLASRMTLYRSQAEVLRTQITQLSNQISGLQSQVASTDGQSQLINTELDDVRALSKDGYAPKTRLLALQRNAVALKGQRGSLMADIARAHQAIGEIRIQLAQLDDKRETDAAEGIRAAQAQLTELEPKLRASSESLRQIDMRAPVAGYVFNLTQFTEGGVAGPGELLMDIVPVNSRLIISTRVRTNDISDVKVGMRSRVTLTAFNARTTPQVEGHVILVGADATEDQQLRETFYTVQVAVEPAELAKAGAHIRLTPGMPATVAIVTGQRTILDYLIGPLTESMRGALHER